MIFSFVLNNVTMASKIKLRISNLLSQIITLEKVSLQDFQLYHSRKALNFLDREQDENCQKSIEKYQFADQSRFEADHDLDEIAEVGVFSTESWLSQAYSHTCR